MKKKSASKSSNKLLISVTTAALALLAAFAGINQLNGELVTRVVDGDSFFIKNGQLVRLYSIDAPEMGLCMSEEAKTKLSSLILGKRVMLRDIRSGGFNRVMGFIYVDGKSVEVEMMKAGLAVLMRGSKDFPELGDASDYARSHHLGVFSPACYQWENVKQPSCNIKGNIGASKNQKHYFTPSCTNYNQTVVWTSFGDQWFCSEKEAENAGFSKGPKCK